MLRDGKRALGSRLLGLYVILIGIWDANAYYIHVQIPNFVFWNFVLPIGLVSYFTFGILFASGKLKIMRGSPK